MLFNWSIESNKEKKKSEAKQKKKKIERYT